MKIQVLFLSMVYVSVLYAADESFDPSFFSGVVADDVKNNAQNGYLSPGYHELQLFLNNEYIDTTDVYIGKNVIPCLEKHHVISMNLKYKSSDFVNIDKLQCFNINESWPESVVDVVVPELKVMITVPQIALQNQDDLNSKMAPSELWVDGELGFVMNYSGAYTYNKSTSMFQDASQESLSFSGDSSLHLGFAGAELITGFFATSTEDQSQNVNFYNAYYKMPLPKQKSVMRAGYTNTSGEVFDAVPMLGISIGTDEMMLSDSQRGYAPVVKGTAKTNAKVQVIHNGSIIREVQVTPGPFEINDLPASNLNSDLTVKIIETTGEVQSFILPYSATFTNLRDGSVKYNISSGRLDDLNKDSYSSTINDTYFIEANFGKGINNFLTVYGGGQFANNGFRSIAIGNAVSTRVGAFSFDTTISQMRTKYDDDRRGYNLRGQYSKTLPEYGTTFSFMTAKYSSEGYTSMSDSIYDGHGESYTSGAKLRTDANISKSLDKYGYISVLYGKTTYWNKSPLSYAQIAYNGELGMASYSLGYSSSLDENSEDSIYLNLSLPLSLLGFDSGYMNTSVTKSSSGDPSFLAGVNGFMGEDNSLNYSINSGLGENNQMFASLSKAHNYGNSAISIGSGGNGSKQLSLSSGGGMVIHRKGVNFSPSLSDTFALVGGDELQDVYVMGSNIEVAGNGYAVVPSLAPYQWNDIGLYSGDRDDATQITSGTKRISPVRGAMNIVSFDADRNTYIYVKAFDRNNKTLPFGVRFKDENGNELGIVGEGGLSYIRVNELERVYADYFDEGHGNKCVFNVPSEKTKNKIFELYCSR
ncbi:MAG: fimbria/pilus outer membrane usher protein [Aeromonas veronii]